jgi:hypothetical protein
MKLIGIRRRLLIILLTVIALAGLSLLLVDRMSQRSLTSVRMHVVKRRVLQYVQSHNQLPASLSVLPEMSGYDNSVQDSWNRNFIYEVDSTGNVTLKSYGKDGVVGGDGENADMIGVFASRDASGKWNDELVPWTVAPFTK